MTVLSFTYGTAAPWPTAPNGGGPTLALLEPQLDNSVPANWAASRETGGTPCTCLLYTSITVIRARTFAAGKMTSPTASNTYLINAPASLTIVSLATDPAHMFSNTIGIYVQGNNGIIKCGKKANWNQSWERPASIEVYNASGARLIAQDIGFEIHGNCTRNLKQKSFELKSRKVYGDNDFSYAFFSDKPLNAYRRLLLRAGGQDTKSLLRDILGQQLLVDRMDIDRQAYRPALVYINGQFWGVYGIRERMDEHFVVSNYGLGLNEFDMIEKKNEVLAGSISGWNTLYSYLSNNSPATPSVYNYLQSQIDIDEYINYQILEIYSDNIDWPHNNIRWWRAHDDGQWRWMVYDLDAAFGRATKGYTNNTFKFAAATKGKRAYNALVLRRLMLNPEFKALFGQRFAAHLNTTYELSLIHI